MAEPSPIKHVPASRDDQTDELIAAVLQQAHDIQKIHPEMFTKGAEVAWLQKQYADLAKAHVDLLYDRSYLQWQVVQLSRELNRKG